MNVQKSLRSLHKDHERQEIEKQKASDEVARLKRTVSAGICKSEYPKTYSRNASQLQNLSTSNNGSINERKKQMSKLIEMGIAVPEEYRAEIAMAGDWHMVSEVQPEIINFTKSEPEENKITLLAKRKRDNTKPGEPDVGDGGTPNLKWGTTIKQYPGWYADGDDDVISSSRFSRENEDVPVKHDMKGENEAIPIKHEMKGENDKDNSPTVHESVAAEPEEAASASTAILFKKRGKKHKTRGSL